MCVCVCVVHEWMEDVVQCTKVQPKITNHMKEERLNGPAGSRGVRRLSAGLTGGGQPAEGRLSHLHCECTHFCWLSVTVVWMCVALFRRCGVSRRFHTDWVWTWVRSLSLERLFSLSYAFALVCVLLPKSCLPPIVWTSFITQHI